MRMIGYYNGMGIYKKLYDYIYLNTLEVESVVSVIVKEIPTYAVPINNDLRVMDEGFVMFR